MKSAERTVTYTSQELREMIRRGEDETDYAYLDAMTEEELEASIDHDEEGEGSGVYVRGFPQVTREASIDPDDEGASSGLIIQGFPHPKREITVEIDGDLIDWFDDVEVGPGPRINAVLRGYVEARKWEEWTMRRDDEGRPGKGEAA